MELPPVSSSSTPISITSPPSSTSRRRTPASASSPYSSRSKLKSPAKKAIRIDNAITARRSSSTINADTESVDSGSIEFVALGQGLTFQAAPTPTSKVGEAKPSGISTTRPPLADKETESETVRDLGSLKVALPAWPLTQTGESKMGGSLDSASPRKQILEAPKVKKSRSKKGKREGRTGIMDLPDELLLQVFSTVHDPFGFRPAERAAFGPEWYRPPLRLGLVCKRWLPIARRTFYRNLSIHHFSRILPLYNTLVLSGHPSINLDGNSLSSFVRRISISVQLRAIISAPASRNVDCEPDSTGEMGMIPSPQNQLKAILQSCSNLIRIDIKDGASNELFTPMTFRKSARVGLQHLHLLRFSTVTFLHLTALSETAPITSSSLRSALLAFSGLETLFIKGYRSTTQKLNLSHPTTTSGGYLTRSLPGRASRLPLKKLVIKESQFDQEDLRALVASGVRGQLHTLIVEEVWNGRSGGGAPTVQALPAIIDFLAGLKVLQIALFNYPIISSSTPLVVGAEPTTSNMVDYLLPHLPLLESLDIGGTVCSSEALARLPPSVQRLTLRGCSTLTASVMCDFLLALSARKATFLADSPSRRKERRLPSIRGVPQWETLSCLKTLDVYGGATKGWSKGEEAWKVQKAAWSAGVTWRGW